jgi:hypothetical protein
MSIKNKYCLLSSLSLDQRDKLMELMPTTDYFDYFVGEELIGFDEKGRAGTWVLYSGKEVITYEEMLSLLGEKELVPHVHQKEIIAWANGEEIEYYSETKIRWSPMSSPSFLPLVKYRVKPELTPTQLRIKELTEELQKLHEQDDVECGIKKVMGN